ncbi:MAG: hypothetical protein CME65_15705 [Halobacteriovoraceae bacterium]|nr:hypothetical protein [Halobacteriovoraceae bacterium]|tara:strand:- start:59965 stop:60882 length:918 start_codon:yes stop_codon:yes gene_type:complete
MNRSTILSSKLTSQNYINATAAGFIDKIELRAIDLEINKNDLIENLKSIGVLFEDARFKNGGYMIKIKSLNGTDTFCQYNHKTNMIHKIILNPSCYSSYYEFSDDILTLLGNVQDIECLAISRLDRTVEVSLVFSSVSRGLNVKHKRSKIAYEFGSGPLTGLSFGKLPSVVKLYDKTLKANLDFPNTRLEVAQTSQKLQDITLAKLKSLWSDQNFYDPTFDHISFNDISLTKPLKRNDEKKLRELEVLFSYFPYRIIQGRLNSGRNFSRDYQRLIKFTPWDLQPSTIFNIGMRKFFNSDEPGAEL